MAACRRETAPCPLRCSPEKRPIAGEAPLVGLAYFRGLEGTGAGFQYIQRVNTAGSGPGNIVFRDVAAMENFRNQFFHGDECDGQQRLDRASDSCPNLRLIM